VKVMSFIMNLNAPICLNVLSYIRQMNEPPGARFEAARTAVALAELLIDQGQDVLYS